MPKNTRPAYYAAPLKSKADIIAFLVAHEDYPSTNSPLAWNVRDYGSDLSPEHLIEVYRTSGEYGKNDQWLDYPEWREPALEKYTESKDRLWDWAIESARSTVTETECYTSLWNGTSLDVEYGFLGRSGGWVAILKYGGRDLTRMDRDDFREWLEEMDYRDLRNLYQLVVQNDHDFRREAVTKEIEFQAAFAWIENICAEVVRPDKTQRELPLVVA
jgi:hypothetical protein